MDTPILVAIIGAIAPTLGILFTLRRVNNIAVTVNGDLKEILLAIRASSLEIREAALSAKESAEKAALAAIEERSRTK